jgi:hypothetical protein
VELEQRLPEVMVGVDAMDEDYEAEEEEKQHDRDEDEDEGDLISRSCGVFCLGLALRHGVL